MKKFNKGELISLLNNIINKTFKEIDTSNVLHRAIDNPKITGIAGDIIEQSVFGYNPNSEQLPDIIIDNEEYELKTTGLRKNVNKNKDTEYTAKENITITAVSLKKIINQEFETSFFWHKASKILFVLYEYSSNKPVPALEYGNFKIINYFINEFSPEDKSLLKEDWLIVRDYLRDVDDNYKNNNDEEELKEGYANLSTKINKILICIDTAPKYPNPPRFRFKKKFINTIIQAHLHPEYYDDFDSSIKTPDDILKKCKMLTILHKNKTVYDLLLELDLDKYINNDKELKNITEVIIINMFGGKSKSLSKIEVFEKFGYIPKTIRFNSKWKPREDMKLFSVNFDSYTLNSSDEDLCYENSEIYEYFNNTRFMFMVFQESTIEEINSNEIFRNKQYNERDMITNKFIGFVPVNISNYDFNIEGEKTWNYILDLVQNNKFKVQEKVNLKGEVIVNKKSNNFQEVNNLPKSKSFNFFVRGGASTSKDKNETLNGYQIMKQYYWFHKKYISEIILSQKFILEE